MAKLLLLLVLFFVFVLPAVRRLRAGRRRREAEWERRPAISPDVEAAARSRFNSDQRPQDTDAIRPADEGVREDGD